MRLLDGLIGTADVRMCEPLEEPSLVDQAAPRPPVVEEIRTQGFGYAAAGALLTPDVVNVEVVAPVKVGNDLVTGHEGVARAQR